MRLDRLAIGQHGGLNRSSLGSLSHKQEVETQLFKVKDWGLNHWDFRRKVCPGYRIFCLVWHCHVLLLFPEVPLTRKSAFRLARLSQV